MELNLLSSPIILTTERLTISSMTEDDWPLFREMQSDAKLMTYIGPVLPEQQLKEKFDGRISPWQGSTEHWLTLKITDKATNRGVGSIGFRLCDIDNLRAEIGYLLLPSAQGKGYVNEASRAIIHFLFEQVKVRKIEAHCCLVNVASWKVMEKLGMKREAHFKAHSYLADAWQDELVYGLISTEIS